MAERKYDRIDQKELESLAQEAAGNWQEFNSFSWHDEPEEGGENWTIVHTESRDSDLVAKSNAKAIQAEMDKPEFKDDVLPQHFNHWAVGWVDGYAIRVYDDKGEITPAFERWCQLVKALEDYPLLDDQDHSQMEYDETIENISDEGGRLVKSEAPEDWAKQVFSWLWANDQRAVEPMDGGGGYPTKEQIRNALLDLNLLDPDEMDDDELEQAGITRQDLINKAQADKTGRLFPEAVHLMVVPNEDLEEEADLRRIMSSNPKCGAEGESLAVTPEKSEVTCPECRKLIEAEEAENMLDIDGKYIPATQKGVADFLGELGYEGTDANLATSLFEYGMVMNPKTGHVIYAKPKDDRAADDDQASLDRFYYDWTQVDQDDIDSALDDAGDRGFFDFVGQDRGTYLEWAKNPQAWPMVVSDLNDWDGKFQQSCTWESWIETLLRNAR